MSKRVVYLAHPVRGDVKANLANVRAWLRYFFRRLPDTAVIAPWMGEVEAWEESGHATDPDIMTKALDDDCEVVTRCDAIVLVGGKISTGMAMERAAALGNREVAIVDLTEWTYPPGDDDPAIILDRAVSRRKDIR